MQVLFYVREDRRASKRLEKVICEAARLADVRVYRSVSEFKGRFSEPQFSTGRPIAVLFAASRKDLQEILSLRGLLERSRVVLVLPDEEEEIARMGHSLAPRYVTYKDSDFEDVAAVLGRMLSSEDAASVL